MSKTKKASGAYNRNGDWVRVYVPTKEEVDAMVAESLRFCGVEDEELVRVRMYQRLCNSPMKE